MSKSTVYMCDVCGHEGHPEESWLGTINWSGWVRTALCGGLSPAEHVCAECFKKARKALEECGKARRKL